MHSSWGSSTAAPALSGTRGEREEQRAEARTRRAAERIAAAEARTEARISARDAQSSMREQQREQRRVEEEQRRAAAADARDARPKRRSSTGSLARTGHATEERDTRHYATELDLDRLRLLARRGASVAALAHAFKISEEAVAEALAD
ncbi:hypothetical protein [Sphingomonas sp. Mn802worker]|uniref:hypothetical protein n=1 Tax=Sphingomonas sp. Mn802worker TaxID=629773 RepID=UPI00037B356B|nr:hypothetical protein [Sphingomonas sp. Mn802worker]